MSKLGFGINSLLHADEKIHIGKVKFASYSLVHRTDFSLLSVSLTAICSKTLDL